MQEYAFKQRHMGTDTVVTLITESETEAKKIAEDTFKKIAAAEQTFSRFLPSSKLSQLNTSGKLIVSEMFVDILSRAIDLHKKTAGAFNPLIQVAKQGYTKDYSSIKNEIVAESSETYNLNVESITINKNTNEVTLAPQQQLDFGGILKGYLAKKMADEIIQNEKFCQGVIVNIGGDLSTQGRDTFNNPFTFYLYNPVTETETELELSNTCLVTSGTYKRHWQTNNGDRHHIISVDGVTNPTSSVISASVVYGDGAMAEAFAKYFLIIKPLSIDKKLLPSGLKYYLVLKDGSVINSSL